MRNQINQHKVWVPMHPNKIVETNFDVKIIWFIKVKRYVNT